MFISGSNFNPDVLIRPLTILRTGLQPTYRNVGGQIVCLCVVTVNLRPQLQECIACRGDQLRNIISRM